MQIYRDNEQTEISVTITSYYQFIIFFGIAAFITTAILLVSMYFLFFVKESTFQVDMLGGLIWPPIFITVTLWFIRGEEKAIIKDSKIKFVRSNGILKFSRTYELCDIIAIRLVDNAFPPDNFMGKSIYQIKMRSRAIPFWTKMGKLSFDFKNKSRTFFNGLNKQQADELIIILTEEIKNRCRVP